VSTVAPAAPSAAPTLAPTGKRASEWSTFLTTPVATHAVTMHGVEADGAAAVGVLCVPTFGEAWARAYRGVRQAAVAIAERGMPAVRFDWAATGRSPGNDAPPLVDQLRALIARLRDAGGPETWCLVAHGVGAAIAARLLDDDPALRLIAWAPEWSGRAHLRHARAFDRMIGLAVDDPPTCVNGIVLGAARCAELHALSVDAPTGPQLLAALPACPGLSDLSDLHTRDGLDDAVAEIVHLVERTAQDVPPAAKAAPSSPAWCVEHLGSDTFRDEAEALRLERSGAPAVALTWHRPVQGRSSGVGLIFVNAGTRPSEGPFHFAMEFGREMAMAGHVVVHLELPGIGDADGRPEIDELESYPADAMDTLRTIARRLRAEPGIRRVAIGGICSGAYFAIRGGAEDLPVDLVLAANPQLYAKGSLSECAAIVERLQSEQWVDGLLERRSLAGRALRALKHPLRTVGILARQLGRRVRPTTPPPMVGAHASQAPRATGAVGCPPRWFDRPMRYALVFSEPDLGYRYLRRHQAALLRALERDARVQWTRYPWDDHPAMRPDSRAVIADAFGAALAAEAARAGATAPR
jgi:alpha-beta hydrolase superfamily lysophospholipase